MEQGHRTRDAALGRRKPEKGDPLRGTLEVNGMDVEANIIANPKSREVLGVDDEGKIIARAEGLSEAYQQKKGVQPTTDLQTDQQQQTTTNLSQEDQMQQQEVVTNDPAQKGMEQYVEDRQVHHEEVERPVIDEIISDEQMAAQAAEYFSKNTADEGLDPFLGELARDLNADVSELNDIPFMPDDPTVMDQQAGKDVDTVGTIAESGKQVNEPGQELAGKEVNQKGPELAGDTTKVEAKKAADDKKKVTQRKPPVRQKKRSSVSLPGSTHRLMIGDHRKAKALAVGRSPPVAGRALVSSPPQQAGLFLQSLTHELTSFKISI
ncbi:hypothetical protein LWM68_08275 [Niabella sp. W65]|nr:hypothetical protein [Niabella sp. W65]MCH7362760.1 hypothetical protein [Niabella sp. W65]